MNEPKKKKRKRIENILSTRTSIRPNIPRPLPPLSPLLPNLLTSQPLIITIIPLPNSLRDLNLGLGPNSLSRIPPLIPGESFSTADLEELEGALGAMARGDVAGSLVWGFGYWAGG